MEQAQRLFEDRNHPSPRDVSLRRIIFRSYRRLRQFDIPIAKVVPEKVIETLNRAVEVIGVKLRIHLAGRLIKTREYAAIVHGKICRTARKRIFDRIRALGIELTE